MLPAQLSAESFKAYPPKGRALAVANLPLLQDLPLGFVPFLLRELLVYDWKFPYEQGELTSQLAYLSKLWPQQRKREMEPFAGLKLDAKNENFDWVNQPAQFLEQLSAHLWATQQMDGFRDASEAYVHKFYGSLPAEQVAAPRLGVAVFGQGVSSTQYPLFRKLRDKGVYFSKVNPAKGLETIWDALKTRAAAHSAPYAHWCVEGAAMSASLPGFTCVSYDGLAAVRGKLAAMMLTAYEAPKFDPEQLRTMLATASPESVGMADSGDGALDRFQLSLLTEGSGTQIYSTTFVQWAAREALRRAHPITMFTRYTPRQKERTMDELLSGGQKKTAATDPEGSLIDGDMAAYYTWINMQRLPGADEARFLAWFEGHGEALAIAPGLKDGSEDQSPIEMAALLAKLG
jgi:hypothetical protein